MIEILWAVAVLTVLGFLLGLGLSVASKVLYVEVDTRVEDVTAMLPNANCGGCGFPGCSGFATALVEGNAKKVSQCRPSKPEARQNIKDYLANNPGPDGSTINVDL